MLLPALVHFEVFGMECLAEIRNLSAKFYFVYSHSKFPEIEYKRNRPYACLLIEYLDDILICVPFRSHVRHPYAYHFKNSVRSRNNRSALDYSKSVLIKDVSYLEQNKQAVVDQDEYTEVVANLPRIAREVYKYVADYQADLNGSRKLHPREWQRRYGMSTLPYFDSLLQT